MAGVIRAVKPLNRWDHDSIRPGSVGSVGDVLGQVRLKNSAPDLPYRWEMSTAKKNEPRVGSNVQNGSQASFTSGGLGAETIDSTWTRDTFMTQRGWTHQDLSAPDKLVIPVDIPAPSYSWANRQANIYEARRTGQNFLPLPGGFAPEGGVPRGGSAPQMEAIGGGAVDRITLATGSFIDPPTDIFMDDDRPKKQVPNSAGPSHMEQGSGQKMR